ncbi:MAG: hypothetical protein R2707_16445 [Acidimicrobiales bacterium]
MTKERDIRVEPVHREVLDWQSLAVALLQLVADESKAHEVSSAPSAVDGHSHDDDDSESDDKEAA